MTVGVIAFTISGQRQRYLRQALDSWMAVRGVRDWELLFCLEPCRDVFPVAEFTRWVRDVFPFSRVRVEVADEQLGCLRNTSRALDTAFAAGAEFTVLAEEDVVVSDDVLEYFAWARDAYAAEDQVAAVCAHSKQADTADPAAVVRSTWFNPVAWGTWAGRWRGFLGPGWGPVPGNREGWDVHIRHQLIKTRKQCVFPVSSRARHIGEISTITPGQLAAHFYQQSLTSTFQQHRPPQDYREVEFTPGLGLLV